MLENFNASATPCNAYSCFQAASAGEAVASLLLSPLSLYSWLTSTVLRLILSFPALFLTSVHHSLLLLLAWPWSVLSICVSLLLTCLRVALYLLHLAVVLGAMAVLKMVPHRAAVDTTAGDKGCQPKTTGNLQPRTRLKLFGRRVEQQG